MGFNFGFFGTPEHRVFNYKPRYYDPQKDELKQKFGRVDGSLEAKDDEGKYIPGSIIKGSFRDGNYQEQRSHGGMAVKIIGAIAMILIFIALIYVAKCWPAIINSLS